MESTDSNQGVVISGEASESDEEFLDISIQKSPKSDHVQISTWSSQSDSAKPHKHTTSKQSKFTSLLHRKLRERNEELSKALQNTVCSLYTTSATDLLNISSNLSKSQAAIQDVSHNMRLLTNDLFHLEDKLDIIATCSLLPDINL